MRYKTAEEVLGIYSILYYRFYGSLGIQRRDPWDIHVERMSFLGIWREGFLSEYMGDFLLRHTRQYMGTTTKCSIT